MILQDFLCLDIFTYCVTRILGPSTEISKGHVFVLRMWIGYSIDTAILFILKYKNRLALDKLTMGFFMYISLSLSFFTILVPGHVESDIDLLMLLSYFKATSTLSAAILYRLTKKTKEKTSMNSLCIWLCCLDLSFNLAQAISSYIVLLLMTFSDAYGSGTNFHFKQMISQLR